VKKCDTIEKTLDGVGYCQISIIYIASKHSHAQKAVLIYWGDNGAIAGEDVYIIDKTGRMVDIAGIDNHPIKDIPIVTVSYCHQSAICIHWNALHSSLSRTSQIVNVYCR